MYDTNGPLQFHEILQHIDLGIYWALKTRDFQDNPPRTIPALKEHICEGIDGKPVNILQDIMKYTVSLKRCNLPVSLDPLFDLEVLF